MNEPSQPAFGTVPPILEELLRRSREEPKSLRRFFWVLVFVFGLAVIALSVLSVIAPKFTDATKNEGDFLRVAVPVIVVAIGFGVTFLGLKRLEQFDNEINLLRVGLMTQLTEERKLAAEERKQIQAQLDARVRDVSTDIKNRAEGLVAEAIKSRVEEMDKRATGFEKAVGEQIQQTTTSLAPYLWLRQHEPELNTLSTVETVGLAHTAASKFVATGKMDLAFRVMREVVERDITGDPDEFHNLGVVAAQADHYALAAALTDCGLKAFPTNVDLIADGLNYHSKSGNWARCRELRDALTSIPRGQWNWRAFTFLADYHFQAGEVEQGLAVYVEHQQATPTEDKAYSSHGQYYVRLGQPERAIEILNKVTKLTRRCPQSASMLASAHLLLAEYEQAIRAVDLALEGAAELQESANVSMMVMNRAFAREGLLRQRLEEMVAANDPEAADEVVQLARRAAADYRLALEITTQRPLHMQVDSAVLLVVPTRLVLLRAELSIHGFPDDLVHAIVPQEPPAGGDALLRAVLARAQGEMREDGPLMPDEGRDE